MAGVVLLGEGLLAVSTILNLSTGHAVQGRRYPQQQADVYRR